jgi:hypothetical protein
VQGCACSAHLTSFQRYWHGRLERGGALFSFLFLSVVNPQTPGRKKSARAPEKCEMRTRLFAEREGRVLR